ncbi:hypothetical protein [Chelatococcus sp.]|nr:hypothetical protein [Chelatococcus sp.]
MTRAGGVGRGLPQSAIGGLDGQRHLPKTGKPVGFKKKAARR